MRSLVRPLLNTLLLLIITSAINAQFLSKKSDPARATYISLDGQALSKKNAHNRDGNIYGTGSLVLHIVRTKSTAPKGSILLLPGEGRELLELKNEAKEMSRLLNTEGFDIVILEYHVSADPKVRDLALGDAMRAFRLLKEKHRKFGLHGDRLCIMGLHSGGHLAARMVRKLDEKEQPDDLFLISPSCMNETLPGTVFPAVTPPLRPTARLFTSFFSSENKEWIKSGQEYTKTWIGYDGSAGFHLLSDSGLAGDARLANNPDMTALLKAFLDKKPEIQSANINPAAVPVAGYNPQRHNEKLAIIAKEKFDLIWIGNSITNNFEKPEYQPVWKKFFAPRKAINLGYSGYRTENIIWNIQNGELEGQSPKVIVLEIGTNNIDEKNYPTRHTADQLAGGIETIVKLLREKCPEAKIIILRSFPGCYGGPNPTSHRAILERASDLVSGLADGKHVYYCDVNHVFLNMDGSINKDMMPDWLHPGPAGSKAFAQAMEPLLSELMEDKSLDTEIPVNSAIVPVSKLENDSYNWWDRHAEVLRIKDSIDPEIVLIGNSITHFWGGLPQLKYADGKPRNGNGPRAWDLLFHDFRVLNLGFGWDRTQNVLWRLDRGELDGLHPRTVIINIGTNNTSETQNARMNTASEIVEGIGAICGRVRSKIPGAKIILMAVFPREQSPNHPRRVLIREINRQLEIFAREQKITFVDIGSKMLAADGSFPKDIANDFCHPTEKGYRIWADAIKALIRDL